MNLSPAFSISSRRKNRASAFTLAEMLVVVAIFSMVIAGMVCLQLFAARIYTLSATKLGATADARKTLNTLRDEIRSAKGLDVGLYTVSSGAFNPLTDGLEQVGNALKIYPSTNSTPYVIVYQNPAATNLCSVSNGVVTVLANFVTNYYCFQAENFQGTILTNNQNNRVIRLTMQFSQWEYPIAFVGGYGINAYDFYQLRTRITQRQINYD